MSKLKNIEMSLVRCCAAQRKQACPSPRTLTPFPRQRIAGRHCLSSLCKGGRVAGRRKEYAEAQEAPGRRGTGAQEHRDRVTLRASLPSHVTPTADPLELDRLLAYANLIGMYHATTAPPGWHPGTLAPWETQDATPACGDAGRDKTQDTTRRRP